MSSPLQGRNLSSSVINCYSFRITASVKKFSYHNAFSLKSCCKFAGLDVSPFFLPATVSFFVMCLNFKRYGESSCVLALFSACSGFLFLFVRQKSFKIICQIKNLNTFYSTLGKMYRRSKLADRHSYPVELQIVKTLQ